MKKQIIFCVAFLLTLVSLNARIVGRIENGVAVVVLNHGEFEQLLISECTNEGLTNVQLISMAMDYDVNNPSESGWFEFRFSYLEPNDPTIHYASVARECTLNAATNEFEPMEIALGGGKTICKASNCGDGCIAKRNGCTACQIPNPPPNPPVAGECNQETSAGGGTLGADVIKAVVTAALAWLAVHCC